MVNSWVPLLLASLLILRRNCPTGGSANLSDLQLPAEPATSSLPGLQSDAAYQLVKLADGICSIHSLQHGETLHPSVGPAAEAEALYVRQLRIVDRLTAHPGEFVIWDIGLGGAANAIGVLNAIQSIPCSVHLVSFDHTLEPLRFGLRHAVELDYLRGWEKHLESLIADRRVHIQQGAAEVHWELHEGDFPSWLRTTKVSATLKPHAILFDAYSPRKNPEMWTLPLFSDLFRALDPRRPCSLSTYSRSTMVRVALLMAGFYVGTGRALGAKEETTVASNHFELLNDPLTAEWLERARRSGSAEPLMDNRYRQAVLSPESEQRLLQHPQFRGNRACT